ncbi:MAG: glutamine synthetase [Deltaproteobacteria bacterium]|nr:glutamine synthetase [Deltaproteobacteria bacterium]MBW2050785.1 glutamine synthetase [Deltaproteobacteria bacterium]MBW2139534.1 glutamine synthetase [Deltaproteobacteria bacterium]MBW2321936.1 glutamine synthetase [Deltaproteobacteria bacterium]
MNSLAEEDILKKISDLEVSFVQFWFTDVQGRLKSLAVDATDLDEALKDGIGFDGSSIEGFARIEESDMIAKPDLSTFQILPWRPADRPVARMFCDIYEPEGTPYPGDPRHTLKDLIDRLLGDTYKYMVGPELEYYYFKDNRTPEPVDQGGFFDTRPLDLCTDLRRASIFALQSMGIKVNYSHHEVSPGQNEIHLRYDEVLRMADNTMTYRIVLKEVAHQNGVYASFMPKPVQDLNGSGMHVHQSLFKDGRNAFYDPDDPNRLSKLAKHFMGGLLYHAREITAITNQWINSYKRLVPGYGAPSYIAWAKRSRSALMRVPVYKPGKENSTRFEYRAPDPACNPYLAFAVMLAAGMEGVKYEYPLLDPVDVDISSLSRQDQEKMGISFLPGNLYEALQELEKGELVKSAIGEHIFNKFIENKKIEWERYRSQVTQFEIAQYFPTL